ncbi:unnamed protein product [Clonostachys rhizophaga]|uniref:Uncharacterized protein n=1 Tax=Clonostachys rhizophaga TaxID=160324 RepID=A0A9N9VCK1_9HYPO|nr:unnamed protein product [Clonostachys rhizophaga]
MDTGFHIPVSFESLDAQYLTFGYTRIGDTLTPIFPVGFRSALVPMWATVPAIFAVERYEAEKKKEKKKKEEERELEERELEEREAEVERREERAERGRGELQVWQREVWEWEQEVEGDKKEVWQRERAARRRERDCL